MTLIVQNDAGTVEDANAYIDYAYYVAHFTARGPAPTKPKSEIEKAIIRATEFIDLRCERGFPGKRLTGYDQTTAFPRSLIFQDDGYTPIVGIPNTLKKATAELAKRALDGALTADQTAGAANLGPAYRKREKVGQIEEETSYASTSFQAALRSPQVASLLAPLLARAASGTYR